jgi:hypothetical protein
MTKAFVPRRPHSAKARVLASLLGVAGAAWAISGVAQSTLSSVVVKPEWLRVNCALRLPAEEYAACVRARADQAGPLDTSKRDHYGEFYDPVKYVECRLEIDPANMRCEYLLLKRREEPEMWPYPDIAKPSPIPPPNPTIYRSGMTSREYFEALCKTEAGDFIQRKVESVEGVYQIRPRQVWTSNETRDRFVLEDPYGYTDAEARSSEIYFVQPPFGKYQFLETWSTTGSSQRWIRFSRDDPSRSSKDFKYQAGPEQGYRTVTTPFIVKQEPVDGLKSRYGYTWRGIRRPFDRENNIAGGETLVLDLKTGEILAIRRGFVLAAPSKEVPWHPLNWEGGAVCPRRQLAGPTDFISTVLRPVVAK